MTQQRVYFVHSAKALYVSLGACKGLGLVPEYFPQRVPLTVGAVRSDNTPGREWCQMPPKPVEVPISSLEKNVARLEQWLPQHFSSTLSTLPGLLSQ